MNKKAFTLIELLVVILIMGILAAIAVPQYMKIQRTALVAQGMATLKTFEKAINRHLALTGGRWPSSYEDLDISYKCTGNKLCTIGRYTFNIAQQGNLTNNANRLFTGCLDNSDCKNTGYMSAYSLNDNLLIILALSYYTDTNIKQVRISTSCMEYYKSGIQRTPGCGGYMQKNRTDYHTEANGNSRYRFEESRSENMGIDSFTGGNISWDY